MQLHDYAAILCAIIGAVSVIGIISMIAAIVTTYITDKYK